jgi:pSer/pThr/pTyr-binding forkhead associated (FHA) protein
MRPPGLSEGDIMEVKLVVLNGKHKDRVIPLPSTIFLIGRDRQCHLRPHCPLVSKLHCAIAPWAGRVRVRDLKSRNGTFLNGHPVDGEVLVRDGDRLQVGALAFAFRINKAEDEPVPPPVKEDEVAWLLNAPADSSVLLPTRPTSVLPVSGDRGESPDSKHGGAQEAASAATGNKRSSKAVSAGQHLRDYFDQRKRRPGGAKRNSPPPLTK